MKRRGFALIALLVVTAITAILAGTPFLARAKARAKACHLHYLNNLKQLAMAVSLYAQDNENRLPMGVDQRGVYWYTALNSYVRNEQVYPRSGTLCPMRA